MKVYFLIASVIYVLHIIIVVTNSVDGVVLQNGTLSHLDLLIQKSMSYKHHKENYIKSLEEGITPSGLQIKKKPAFLPVSEDFEIKWNAILRDAEKKIIKLLMYESNQVIAKIEAEIQEELKEEDPNRFRKKLNQLENKHASFRKLLEKKRGKKWQKFKITTKSTIQNNINLTLTLTGKVNKNNDSINISSNQSGNYPNNGHNIVTSREGSSNINLLESLISGSSSNVIIKEEENHLNGNNRFINDNRKTREKFKQRLNRTKETVTTVKSNNVLTEDKQQGNENGKSYAEVVKCNRMNISNDTVDLSEICDQVLE